MLFAYIFAFVWGFVTSYLGLGWSETDIATFILVNVIPVVAVMLARFLK